MYNSERYRKNFENKKIKENITSNNKKLIEIRDLLSNNKLKFLEEIENFTKNINITSNQLRNLYDIVVNMNIEDSKDVEKKLLKLRITLEYAYRRETIKDNNFYYCMKEAIEDTLQNSKDLNKVNNFLQMFESIVAYSKVR